MAVGSKWQKWRWFSVYATALWYVLGIDGTSAARCDAFGKVDVQHIRWPPSHTMSSGFVTKAWRTSFKIITLLLLDIFSHILQGSSWQQTACTEQGLSPKPSPHINENTYSTPWTREHRVSLMHAERQSLRKSVRLPTVQEKSLKLRDAQMRRRDQGRIRKKDMFQLVAVSPCSRLHRTGLLRIADIKPCNLPKVADGSSLRDIKDGPCGGWHGILK